MLNICDVDGGEGLELSLCNNHQCVSNILINIFNILRLHICITIC